MKPTYVFSLTFLGGAVGWPAVKAVLFPMIVWSGTAAGSAAYVHWVIKSHNANVVRLQGGGANAGSGSGGGDQEHASAFLDDLIGSIAMRQTFVAAYRSDAPSNYFVKAKIDSMLVEDTKTLVEADHLKSQPPSEFTADLATKADELRSLDDQLKILSEQVASKNRS